MAKSRHFRKGFSRNRGNSNPANRGQFFPPRTPNLSHPVEFQLSRDILAFSDECLGGFQLHTRTQQTVVALVDYVIENHGAFVSMTEHSRPFHSAAASAVRAMFESTVNAEFLWRQPDETLVERFVAYEVWEQWHQFLDAVKTEPMTVNKTTEDDIRKRVHEYMEITQGENFDWEKSEIKTVLKFDFTGFDDWDIAEADAVDDDKKLEDLRTALPKLQILKKQKIPGFGAVCDTVEAAIKKFEKRSVSRPSSRNLRERCRWIDERITDTLRADDPSVEDYHAIEAQYVVIYKHLSQYVHGTAKMVAMRLRNPHQIGHIATPMEVAMLADYANTITLRALYLAINLITKADPSRAAVLVPKWKALHNRHAGFISGTKVFTTTVFPAGVGAKFNVGMVTATST